MAGAGAEAGTEITDKGGAENNLFRLSNTVSTIQYETSEDFREIGRYEIALPPYPNVKNLSTETADPTVATETVLKW